MSFLERVVSKDRRQNGTIRKNNYRTYFCNCRVTILNTHCVSTFPIDYVTCHLNVTFFLNCPTLLPGLDCSNTNYPYLHFRIVNQFYLSVYSTLFVVYPFYTKLSSDTLLLSLQSRLIFGSYLVIT